MLQGRMRGILRLTAKVQVDFSGDLLKLVSLYGQSLRWPGALQVRRETELVLLVQVTSMLGHFGCQFGCEHRSQSKWHFDIISISFAAAPRSVRLFRWSLRVTASQCPAELPILVWLKKNPSKTGQFDM